MYTFGSLGKGKINLCSHYSINCRVDLAIFIETPPLQIVVYLCKYTKCICFNPRHSLPEHLPGKNAQNPMKLIKHSYLAKPIISRDAVKTRCISFFITF